MIDIFVPGNQKLAKDAMAGADATPDRINRSWNVVVVGNNANKWMVNGIKKS